MSGDWLMCVWDAAFTRCPDTTDNYLSRNALRSVLSFLDIGVSQKEFDQFFQTNDDVNVGRFRRYLFDVLFEEGTMESSIQENLENKCWELSEIFYHSNVLSSPTLKKVWQICNRLVDGDSFPPRISPKVADWFFQMVCVKLDKIWKQKPVRREMQYYTCCTLITRLVEDLFMKEPRTAADMCIDSLYSCFVQEIMTSGWLYKRHRPRGSWKKTWCELSAASLSFYDRHTTKKPGTCSGKILMKGSKVELQQPINTFFCKKEFRMKITSISNVQIELASDTACQRRAWVSCLQEAIYAADNNTTPFQRTLKQICASATAAPPVVDYIAQESKDVDFTDGPQTAAVLPWMLDGSITTEDEEEETFDNAGHTLSIAESYNKIKAVFMKTDSNGDGKIDQSEFRQFLRQLELEITNPAINLIFKSIAKTNESYMTFDEFSSYITKLVLKEDQLSETEHTLQAAFLAANRRGSGSLTFREFSEFVSDQKRSILIEDLWAEFDKIDMDESGTLSYDEFRQFYKNKLTSLPKRMTSDANDTVQSLKGVVSKVKEFYNDTDSKDVTGLVQERWNMFATLRRRGTSGRPVLTGAHGMVDDVLPGHYSLVDLVCFSDLEPVIPKHTVAKGIQWASGKTPGRSGKLIFPKDFDGAIATDTATNEMLRYYGCSFAEGNQLKITLLYRHGIQDFTYENQYLEDYVTSANGGAGLEKHDFAHLDCPLNEDCGKFVLGKIVGDDELHLTAFNIPVRHTLYVPGGVIHSNDYLRGTWRTMLSDMDIDHVHLVRATDHQEVQHFLFSFDA